GFAIVGLAKRATATVMKTVGSRFGLTRKPAKKGDADPEAALEAHVDLHEFHPHMVEAWAKKAGFEPVRIETEEFVSGIFGWSVRTVEALARPGLLALLGVPLPLYPPDDPPSAAPGRSARVPRSERPAVRAEWLRAAAARAVGVRREAQRDPVSRRQSARRRPGRLRRQEHD